MDVNGLKEACQSTPVVTLHSHCLLDLIHAYEVTQGALEGLTQSSLLAVLRPLEMYGVSASTVGVDDATEVMLPLSAVREIYAALHRLLGTMEVAR